MAFLRSPSPCRLATRAETALEIAKKDVIANIFGWVVSPIAAIASGPRDEIIKVSMIPARAIKKDSKTAGHAMAKALL